MERVLVNSTADRDAIAALGGLVGCARVWVAGRPATPTDRWIVWTERARGELPAETRDIHEQRRGLVDERTAEHFTRTGRQLEGYGSAARRSFHMDVHLTAAEIAGLEA